jgi:hypothetical protein
MMPTERIVPVIFAFICAVFFAVHLTILVWRKWHRWHFFLKYRHLYAWVEMRGERGGSEVGYRLIDFYAPVAEDISEDFRTVFSLVCSTGETLIPAFNNSWTRHTEVGEVIRMKWFTPLAAKTITERVEGHNRNLKERLEKLYREEMKIGVKRRIK